MILSSLATIWAETYEDGSYISAYYNRTGNGKLSYYRTEGIFED